MKIRSAGSRPAGQVDRLFLHGEPRRESAPSSPTGSENRPGSMFPVTTEPVGVHRGQTGDDATGRETETVAVAVARRGIASGGGIAARVLMVGPRQALWIGEHLSIDRREAELAIARVLVAGAGDVDAVAAHLNVGTGFLLRFSSRAAVRAELKRCGIHLVEGTGGAGSPLLPWEPPTDREGVRALATYRVPSDRGSRGAWRFAAMLSDARTRDITIDVLRELAAEARSANEVAAALDIDRTYLWRLREIHPDLEEIVQDAIALRQQALAERNRRLTLEEAIDHLSPFLPATPRELNDRLRAAAERGEIVHRGRSWDFLRYVGRSDARQRMIVRVSVDHWHADRSKHEWRLVQRAIAS